MKKEINIASFEGYLEVKKAEYDDRICLSIVITIPFVSMETIEILAIENLKDAKLRYIE